MNIQTLDADIDFLCGSTSASYSPTNKRRNMNVALQDVARVIWESQGGWQYDDSNATTLPLAKTTIVHNQQDYALPPTSQRLEGVIVKDSGGNWVKLQPIDIHEIDVAMPEYLETSGMPIYYNLVGRSVELYPKPSSAYVTLASGLGVYVSRDVTEFAVSATTETPGFPTAFHRILSYAAAVDFVQDPTARQQLVIQKDRLEKGLTRFYSKRAVESKQQIEPRSKKTWRQYI
jgi:hypothetical protein